MVSLMLQRGQTIQINTNSQHLNRAIDRQSLCSLFRHRILTQRYIILYNSIVQTDVQICIRKGKGR